MHAEREAARARNITPARVITLAAFTVLAAASSRTDPAFWVLLAVCVLWVAGTVAARAHLRAIVVGDATFVLAALATTGQEASDLRWLVVVLPVAWATLYSSRSLLFSGPAWIALVLAVLSSAFTEDVWHGSTWAFCVAFAASCALAWANGRESERALARVAALESSRQALFELALSAEERERARLSEVLHDESLQYLLAAGQDLEELQPAGELAEPLGRAQESLGHGLRTLRSIVRTMHPLTVFAGDLEQMLQELARTLGPRGGFSTTIDVEEGASGQADALVISLVRELMTNTVKHASATRVEVEVRGSRREGELRLRVCDDGVGIAPERPELAREEGHIGLALAQDRVRAGGGTWTLESAPGAGVRVEIVLPLGDRRSP